jgi:hypothetical protein
MNIVAQYTTVVQTEKYFMRALLLVAKVNLQQQLEASIIAVIDCEAVTASNTCPRKNIPVSTMTQTGNICCKRAQLEAQRRFCGNKSLTIDGLDSALKPQAEPDDIVSAFLDPRTFRWARDYFDLSTRKAVKTTLKSEYLRYTETWRTWNHGQPDSASSDSDSNNDANMHANGADLDGWLAYKPSTVDPREEEFESAWFHWVKTMLSLNWQEIWREGDVKDHTPNPLVLREAPLGNLFQLWIKSDKFGLLPYLALFSKFSICGLAAASFCERVNSQANHIVRKDNTRLKSETIEKAVMMRMNTELFEHLKQKYSTVPIEQVLEVAQSR